MPLLPPPLTWRLHVVTSEVRCLPAGFLLPLDVTLYAFHGQYCCRGDLLDALRQLDDEDDVNKALKYFSYEHFYVIYCKASPWASQSQNPMSFSSQSNCAKGMQQRATFPALKAGRCCL